MLFLQALLFFILGISVVAIPISPMISDISPRGTGESVQHSSSHEKSKLDGLWTAYHREYHTRKFTMSYMKIINEAIVRIWPVPDQKEAAEELVFGGQVPVQWHREETPNAADLVSGFPLLEKS
jgi:hypothetical protein